MESITTISLVVGITMAILKIAEFGLTKFFEYLNKTTDGKDVNSQQETEIAILQRDVDSIKSNHLIHIQASLDKNTEEHTSIKVILGKICQKLE